MRTRPRRCAWAWLAAAATSSAMLAGTACSGNRDADSATASPVEGEILVFAASSLTEAFKEAGKAFEAANPRAKVSFNFAGSSALAVQINEGAPADVFASADGAQMDLVTAKGSVEAAQVFARNVPVVVVARDGKTVASFADLGKPGVRVVLAAKEVPIGRYARQVLAKASAGGAISPDFAARVLANVKSDEANVRAVLTRVQLGEADAGIVYATDIAAATGDVRGVEIPPEYNVVADYPIALVKGTKHPATAAAFVAFVLSPAGQAILRAHGFAGPG